jgi:transcriptional regulator with XRE-family HTH domain
MAMHPKPENRRNPLRVLRGVLSEEGKRKPITQHDLADLLSVPVNTIKAIEAGQRPFKGSAIADKLVRLHGALWEAGPKQWVSVFGAQKHPYTLAIWREIERQRLKRPRNSDDHVRLLQRNLEELLKLVPDKRWWELRFRCEQFIRDCWSEFGAAEKVSLVALNMGPQDVSGDVWQPPKPKRKRQRRK